MGENYIFAVARIRVLEKSLLTDADIMQMSSMKDENSVVGYLLDKGWGDENSGRDPVRILATESEKLNTLIRNLGVGDDVLNVLSYPQVFHNLKAAIKDIGTSSSTESLYYDIPKYTGKYFTDILSERKFEELPESMREPAEEALSLMLEKHDGQRSDIIIDKACLTLMEQVSKKSKYPILRDYLERTVAVSDIKIAVRGARTGKTFDFIKKAMAPCRTLKVEDLAKAASEGDEALLNYLSDHSMLDAAEALKTSITSFEKWCDDSVIESIRYQKTNPFTIGPVVAYYIGRENEIKTVRVLLTAKHNDFPEEAIKERARRMYG